MDDVQKGLLNEIAAGLLRASEAARALAEHEPEKVTFELDGGIDLINIGQYGAFGCIECDLCGAKSKSVKLIGPKQFESEEAFWTQRAWDPAVRNWNRRYEGREEHDKDSV